MSKKYSRYEEVNGDIVLVVVTHDELIHLVGEDNVEDFINAQGWDHYSDESFREYQEATAQTAKYPKDKAVEYLTLGLTSEAGEVAGKLKKLIRDADPNNPSEEWVQMMASEMGDVLWYLARLADELGLSLSQIAEDNMDKLLDRKARGVIGGSGDNR
jgi:NTP pyrophosphatase (non-canonical NTP hydrolase)